LENVYDCAIAVCENGDTPRNIKTSKFLIIIAADWPTKTWALALIITEFIIAFFQS